MTPADKTFVDTNVLVYAHAVGDSDPRARRAREQLSALWRDESGIASSQVLQEFYSAATRKLKPPLAKTSARAVVAVYADWCRLPIDPSMIVAASHLEEQHTLSFWDALIVETATRCGAATLLTEDLQDGRRFGDLTIVNPFRDLEHVV